MRPFRFVLRHAQLRLCSFIPRSRRRVLLVLVLAGALWSSPWLTLSVHAQTPVIHVVNPGETLSEIARLYGVSLYRLATYNGIRNWNLLRAGQRLRIPPMEILYLPATSSVPTRVEASPSRSHPPSGNSSLGRPTPTPAVSPAATPPPLPTPPPCLREPRYIVQPGDTLWAISRRYGIPLSHIKARNRLPSARIYVGQRLIIPCP